MYTRLPGIAQLARCFFPDNVVKSGCPIIEPILILMRSDFLDVGDLEHTAKVSS